jgi:hypothetical protein
MVCVWSAKGYPCSKTKVRASKRCGTDLWPVLFLGGGPLDPFEMFGTVKQNVAALSAQVIEYGYGVFCM